MKKYDYLIVGAGLFGAVCAFELTKKNKKCLVVEKRDHVGGNVYTETIEKINVHKYGPHIFHTSNEKIWKYVNSFAKFNNFINSPIAKYKNEQFNLPFNMDTFSQLWPDIVTEEDARKKIKNEKDLLVDHPRNLKEKAISLVGKTLFEKLIKGYTEKQWGKSCEKLPASIIDRIPVRFTFNNNYYDDSFQGIPEGGYTQIIEKMLTGVDVLTSFNYFDHKDELKNIADKIIFSGQIDEYFNYCYGPLEYRSLSWSTEVLNIPDFQGNAVVNYTSHDVPYTRIIEHKHFEFGKQPKTIISKEYPMAWKFGDEPYYPINDDKNMKLYLKYNELANNEKNVIFGGRLGCYKYYDMDKVIESALNLVARITD